MYVEAQQQSTTCKEQIVEYMLLRDVYSLVHPPLTQLTYSLMPCTPFLGPHSLFLLLLLLSYSCSPTTLSTYLSTRHALYTRPAADVPMYPCTYYSWRPGQCQSVSPSFVRSLVARQRPPLSVTAIEYGEEREGERSTTTASTAAADE